MALAHLPTSCYVYSVGRDSWAGQPAHTVRSCVILGLPTSVPGTSFNGRCYVRAALEWAAPKGCGYAKQAEVDDAHHRGVRHGYDGGDGLRSDWRSRLVQGRRRAGAGERAGG